MTTATRQPHIGHNIKRIREILCIKQEYLAVQLGLSQQAISHLEQRETVDAPTLEKVAKILNVPVEAIKNYDDETAVNIISSTFNDHAIGYVKSYTPTFNPIDKIVELYEALVKSEREKVEILQRMLNERK